MYDSTSALGKKGKDFKGIRINEKGSWDRGALENPSGRSKTIIRRTTTLLPLFRTQDDFEDNEVEANPKKRRAPRKNPTDSASVQAKMSLDLIVEQLRREMSLKDIKSKEQSVLTSSTTEPKDFLGIAGEESPRIVNREERGVMTEPEKETTDPIDVNVVSMSFQGLEREERERTDREGQETISSREPEEASLEPAKENEDDDAREISQRLGVGSDRVTENGLVERDNDDVGFASMFVIECKESSDRPEERRINEGGNTSAKDDDKKDEKEEEEKEEEKEEEGGFKDRETQTERVHTIRAARSCPLQKRRIYRLFFGDLRNKVELLGWIHRKASDNLIYEKGKASGSPSYVPLTERFRWRYVGPRKAR
ncbi:DNA ligase 1 [Vespula squamosa]|uniref:DNA ligase 1 n=1 Tax=Vespula squamosa TaxID=30214 RepID=A0ABD2B0U3_VESSQ